MCNVAGCPTLIETGSKCEKHRKGDRRASDARRPSARARGYNRQHEKDRKAYFRVYPFCQWHEGCIALATDLDHIDGNPFNRDRANYRGYCHAHHSRRTAQDQPGGWHAT